MDSILNRLHFGGGLLLVSLLLFGCGDGSEYSEELAQYTEPIALEATETTVVMQSTSLQTQDDGRYVCESYGLRLPTSYELSALANMHRNDDLLDDILAHQDYWSEVKFEDGQGKFGRPAVDLISISDSKDLRGVLCMEGEAVPPPAENDGEDPGLIGSLIDFGTSVAEIPGLKAIAPPLFSFAMKQAGFDDYTKRMESMELKLVDLKNQVTRVDVHIQQIGNRLSKEIAQVKAAVDSQAAGIKAEMKRGKLPIEYLNNSWKDYRRSLMDENIALLDETREDVNRNMTNKLFLFHNIMMTESGNGERILDNFTDHLLKHKNDNFTSAFMVLEAYYLELFYKQQKGLSQYMTFFDHSLPSYKFEMKEIATNLASQVGTEMLGMEIGSYSHNVFRILMDHLHPYDAQGDFFPLGAEEVLRKTEFFRRGVTDQSHDGLFGAFVTTADLYDAELHELCNQEPANERCKFGESLDPSELNFEIRAKIYETTYAYEPECVFSLSAFSSLGCYTGPTMRDTPAQTTTSTSYPVTQIKRYAMLGPTYDFRYADTLGEKAINIKPSDTYYVYTFAVEGLDPDEYTIEITPKQNAYPAGQYVEEFDRVVKETATVSAYNKNYESVSSGSSESVGDYGFVLLGDRVINRYTEKSTLYGKIQNIDYENLKSIGGDENNWPVGFQYDRNKFWSVEARGKRELDANFIYKGKDNNKTVNVDIAARATLKSGAVGKETRGSNRLNFVIGIYDKTDKKRLKEDNEELQDIKSVENEEIKHSVFYLSKEEDVAINTTFSFKPKSGHEYHAYAYVSVDKTMNGHDAHSKDASSVDFKPSATINGIDYLIFRYDR